MDNIQIDLFALAQDYFETFKQEFARYGLTISPSIELRKGEGMLCYYDLKDGNIYLSLPDLKEPHGKLHLLFLRSVFGYTNNAQVYELFSVFIPFLVAHELTHHLRHFYHLFGKNLWYEEQLANQLAIALLKRHLSPQKRQGSLVLLEQSLTHLEAKLGIHEAATNAYRNLWQALSMGKRLKSGMLEHLEIFQRLFDMDPMEALRSSGELSEEIVECLQQREVTINAVNDEYASDFTRYAFYQLSWVYLDLKSPEIEYIDAFAHQHLNLEYLLLPILPEDVNLSETAILALHWAYQQTVSLSKAGSKYFYKRYRETLLSYLQSVDLSSALQTESLRGEANTLLQNWYGHDQELDMLQYLTHLAPESIQLLFPQTISEHPRLASVRIEELPTETDLRLWNFLVSAQPDLAAEHTLDRLAILDKIDLFQPLPIKVLLEIIHYLCLVKLAPGETVIWQGDNNDDLYILIKGSLEVFRTNDLSEYLLNEIGPGEVFGEMSFFTRQSRHASVRAKETSECFVLKGVDFKVLQFRHPIILVQIARILAQRLDTMNRRKYLGGNDHE